MDEKTVRTWQTAIVDGALTAAGLAAAALGVWAVWKENPGLAATGLGGGLVLLFAATIHRFESLKGLGMEAKTRELRKTIDKAEVAVEQLRALAELVGGNMLDLLGSTGRASTTPSIMSSYASSRQLRSLLTAMGSDDEKIRASLAPWAKWTLFDLYYVEHQMVFRKLDAERKRLNEQASGGNPDASYAADQSRATEIGQFKEKALDGNSSWRPDEFPARLLRLLSDVPVLDSTSKNEMEPEITKAVDEARALLANLDLGDLVFWRKISDLRDAPI